MTSNGVPISVALEVYEGGYGENTLIWVPANLSTLNLSSFPPPATDTVYHVTVGNVRISGMPQTFNYDVRVFNPAVPGPDYFPPLITGPTQAFVNASTPYNFTRVSNAAAYQYRQSRLTNITFVDGAENPLTNFTVLAATNLYAVRDSAVKQDWHLFFSLGAHAGGEPDSHAGSIVSRHNEQRAYVSQPAGICVTCPGCPNANLAG